MLYILLVIVNMLLLQAFFNHSYLWFAPFIAVHLSDHREHAVAASLLQSFSLMFSFFQCCTSCWSLWTCCCCKPASTILTHDFLLSVLYILLIIVNMLLLQAFFGGDPRFSVLRHGLWVLENLFANSVWPQSPIFPIKTVCTFSVSNYRFGLEGCWNCL